MTAARALVLALGAAATGALAPGCLSRSDYPELPPLGAEGEGEGEGPACEPVPETCNGLDDDCDGEADEGLGTIPAGRVRGECAGNVQVCTGAGGYRASRDNQLPRDEVCNGLDDDCDGLVDEWDGPPPTLLAPANLTREQHNRDGWTTIIAGPGQEDADPPLVPTVQGGGPGEQEVRVHALGVVPLEPDEARRGGRLLGQVGEVTFPLGETLVRFMGIDCRGNTVTDSTLVTVVDTTPPELEFEPPVMWIEARSSFGTIVPFPDPAHHEDVCDASPQLSWDVEQVCPARMFTDPATGGTVEIPAGRCMLYCEDFSICGDHELTVTTEDLSGNTGSTQFSVHIVDTQPPYLVLPREEASFEQEARCGTTLGSARLPQALLGDAATPRELLLVEKWVLGDDHVYERIGDDFCFPLGSTVVTNKVTDLSGNFTTSETTIEVVDRTKPGVDLIGVPDRLWHSFARTVTIEATDTCDAELDVSVDP